MKSLKFLAIALLAFVGGAASAQSKTDSLKVLGNCGMCKKHIETALKVKGVSTANWNVKTKVLKVSYDPSKVTLDQVQQKVADAGYDTPKYKATKESYLKLDDCCQYDRTGKEQTSH
ncbi:heavy-metal-associated domain-containing protein [Pedobacter frigoris]|uniref:heavy-metal-associated domain-containing protein n=1 Tax=Pedobacter frigoris TaxID=2571272 RepID=UPI002930BDA4|nr:heavy-metal-associated domain-containing protein [Pedobacter frigoris]